MIDVHDELAVALAGHYEIEREIGRGGMATVYLARDVRHDRHVAVKVLRADSPSSLGAERFLREISISARLTHPNILALYDSGAVGSTLYFVMPYVEGQTLRQRLDREHQLPLDEAIAITRQIAGALDYAHERGVVHRDIKPENVLLLGENVLVADFGLARALYSATSPRLTGSATAVGTPAYMSPEQAAGDSDVDGRSDLYSLACVLFEMVTGSPPFQGATVQVLMMHHLSTPPPSICAQRKSCPPWVDDAVRKALEKMPADRFRTAMQFMRALEQQSPGGATITASSLHGPRTSFVASVLRRKRPVIWASTGLLAIAGALVWRTTGSAVATPVLNDTLYLIAPFQHRGGATSGTAAAVTERVNDALAEWRGVLPVVGGAGSLDLDDGNAGDNDRLRVARATALASRARWLVWGDVTDDADSLTVRASLYDAGRNERVGFRLIRHARAGVAPRVRYRELVNALLRSREELPWNLAEDQWRPSLPAWAAYDRGREAIARWDLESAERDFGVAVEADPELAQAHLWLAHLRSWRLDPPSAVRLPARRALEHRERLTQLDGMLAQALAHLAERRLPDACVAYHEVVARDSIDYRGWIGLGDCQSRDTLVVSDRASPSRYRFRSSLYSSLQSYLRAHERMPSPRPNFIYDRISRLLYSETNQYRRGWGRGVPAAAFAAYPILMDDTLAFVPYELAQFASGRGAILTGTHAPAVARNRLALRELYLDWVRESPHNVDAHSMLGELLETMEEIRPTADGQPSALAEIATAHRLSPHAIHRLELSRTRVRLLVKSGDWSAAAALSDSLIMQWPSPQGPATSALIGPAALTGRLRLTAKLLAAQPASSSVAFALPPDEPGVLPPQVRRDGAEMQAYAALGVCTDTLRSFPVRLQRQLESYYTDPDVRQRVVAKLVRGHLINAAPCLGTAPLMTIRGDDPWLRMGQAVAQGSFAGARTELQSLLRGRRGVRPGDVTINFTYYEAWILASIGDTTGAIAHLDRTLSALPTLTKRLLDQPSLSGSLVRAMGLRAELAHAIGDAEGARQWAGAVTSLWGRADPELQSYVATMRRIAATR